MACILSSLTLGIVEIRRDCDHAVFDTLVEISLGGFLHLLKHKTTNLRWRILLTASFNPSIAISVLYDLIWNLLDVSLAFRIREFSTDKTLRGKQSVLWIYNSLTLG